MNKLLTAILFVSLFFSCSKSTPPPTAPTPVTPVTPVTPTTPTTPTTPLVPTSPVPPISLSHPTPLDTLLDWVRIGRVAYLLEDIWFTANKVGFITNDSSLFISRDNGDNWSLIPNTNFNDIFNLQFLDNQNGFVQGVSELGITNDGGNTWVFRQLTTKSVTNFQFVSATTGFYLDPSKGLYKTYDAGNNWTSLSTPQHQYQGNFPFYFLDSLTGFSLNGGNSNKLSNGGFNSVVLSINAFSFFPQGYYKMQFIDSSTGFSGTLNGLIKTIDGGKSWANCLPISGSTTSFMIPYFFDSNNGYCLDRNTIYKTTDGGSNWTISCKLTNDYFSGFHFLDMNTGWASTFGGYVLRLK
jgi:hypothetical protein